MKENYSGKFVELDFSQNLSLRPKDEVHFFGIFVDQVLRDMISVYEIQNEDLRILSDNTPLQYKNKIPFALLKQLASEFKLRIIRTYVATCKAFMDAISSFGTKNVLRRDIVTHDVFFNQREDIVDYFTVKNPLYYYKNISAETVTKALMESNISMEIPGCMEQHLILFTPNCSVMCREYLSDSVSCLQFKFDECLKEQDAGDVDFPEDLERFEDDECEKDIDQNQQIFGFVDVQSLLTLFTGNPAELQSKT